MNRQSKLWYGVFFAIWGACAVLAVTLLVTDLTGEAWLLVPISFCLLVLFAMLYGETRNDQKKSQANTLEPRWHNRSQPTDTCFICLPELGNDGNIVFAQHIGWLSEFGAVLVVNYPEVGFDIDRLVADTIESMEKEPSAWNRHYDRYVFVAQSMGTPVAIEIMRRLREQGSLAKFFLVTTGGFVTARATKGRLMLLLCDIFRDLPGIDRVWPWVLKRQFNPDSVEIEVEADPAVVAEHYQALCGLSYYTQAAQGRWLASVRASAMGEFRDIPLLMLETRGDDVLVKKDRASAELAYALWGSISHKTVGGIHANLVERPHDHREAIQPWLITQLQRQKT